MTELREQLAALIYDAEEANYASQYTTGWTWGRLKADADRPDPNERQWMSVEIRDDHLWLADKILDWFEEEHSA